MSSQVDHADVAGLALGAGVDRRGVPVDGVAVEIEGDVVSADDDAVVWAVDEVAVQRCIGGDGVAAARVACQRLAAARTVKPATTRARTIALETTFFGDRRNGTFRASREGTSSRLDIEASPVTEHQLWWWPG